VNVITKAGATRFGKRFNSAKLSLQRATLATQRTRSSATSSAASSAAVVRNKLFYFGGYQGTID
jgi:hypothetical protein